MKVINDTIKKRIDMIYSLFLIAYRNNNLQLFYDTPNSLNGAIAK